MDGHDSPKQKRRTRIMIYQNECAAREPRPVFAAHTTMRQVCHFLRDQTRQITAARRSDVSRGWEQLGVRVKDSSQGYPSNFTYTFQNVMPAECPTLDMMGCDPCGLQGGVCSSDCPCNCSHDGIHYYNEGGFLSALQGSNGDGRVGFSVRECGPACRCSLGCPNRRSQQGLQVKIELSKDNRKGWTAAAAEDIAQGMFVCQYAGELITIAESERRLANYDRHEGACTGHALLIVREWLPSCQACMRINIDATKIGNVARFFNHSCCGGNLELVVVRCSGSSLPHVAMFARRRIAAGEELTFLYGDPSDGTEALVENGSMRRACYCGAKECLGFLPAESV